MELKLSEKELTNLSKDENAIKLNLVSKALYNESLNFKFNEEDLKNSKYISERVITLPLYESLGLEEVKYICNILKERI